jgi:hypothetical protein
MKRPMNNEELLSHLMNFSKHGALMQLVVLDGLRAYSEQVVKAAPGFLGEASNMFSEEGWRGCCQEYLDAMNNREQMLIEDIAGIEDDEPEEQGDPHSKEKDGLLMVLMHLAEQGWVPIELWDTEEWRTFNNGAPLTSVVEACGDVEMATLRLRRTDGRTGSLGLVWGNSPSELIADYTLDHGFEGAVQAAQRSVWPNYPED